MFPQGCWYDQEREGYNSEPGMGSLISLVPFLPLFKKHFPLSAKNIGTLSKSGLRTSRVNTFLNKNENA